MRLSSFDLDPMGIVHLCLVCTWAKQNTYRVSKNLSSSTRRLQTLFEKRFWLSSRFSFRTCYEFVTIKIRGSKNKRGNKESRNSSRNFHSPGISFKVVNPLRVSGFSPAISSYFFQRFSVFKTKLLPALCF